MAFNNYTLANGIPVHAVHVSRAGEDGKVMQERFWGTVVPPPSGAARPRIPDAGDSENTQKNITNHIRQPNIYPATLREVGPLNNNERGPHLPP